MPSFWAVRNTTAKRAHLATKNQDGCSLASVSSTQLGLPSVCAAPHVKAAESNTSAPRAPCHRTPVTPYSSAQYKANVNRTKTRKWVEAKVQNYDGDDWGADDGFDDDDADADAEPPMPQPSRPGKLTAGLRAISQGSIPSTPRSGSAGSSPSLRPSERIAMEKQQAQGQRSVTGPPSLHIQTQGVQSQPPVPGAGEKPRSASLTANPQFPPRKSSMKGQERPDPIVDPIVHPPRTSSRSASPASQSAVRSPVSATGSTAPKFVRPSDIYKRMEEQKERECQSIDSARPSLESAGDHADAADATAKQPPPPSFGRNDGGGEGVRNLQPLAPVAERKSEYDFDGLMVQPEVASKSTEESKVASEIAPEPAKRSEAEPVPETQPGPGPEPAFSRQPLPPTLDYPQTTAEESTVQPPKKRFSTSPKLPDFARMSGFGPDFFSSAGGLLDGSPKQSGFPEGFQEFAPEPAASTAAARQSQNDAEPLTKDIAAASRTEQEPAAPKQPKPFRPSIPGGWVSETASTPGEMATPLGLSTGNVPTLHEHPEDLSLKPAPLRTPTPRSSSRPVDDEDRASIRSGHGSTGMPPPLRTTPSPSKLSLVERSAETSKDEGHPKEERESSSDSARTSDADLVAPAPLQPRKSPMPDSPAEDLRHSITRLDTDSTTDNASPLKESDVLRDEIIRSLSPVRSSDTHLGPPRDEDAVRESAYLSDVYGDYWNPEDSTSAAPERHAVPGVESPAAVKEDAVTPTPPTDDGTTRAPPAKVEKAAGPAGEAEAVKPTLKRERFSWEAAPESNQSITTPSPTKHELPPLPQEAAPPVPAAAPEPISPVDSTILSPLISLPVLSFLGENEANREGGHERAVSAVSMLPPGSDRAIDLPSPMSRTGDPEHVDGEGRLLSPSEEKIVLASSTSPMSPASPSAVSEPHADRAESPVPTPTDIPLPRSPSPIKDVGVGGEEDFLQAADEKTMMTLHQIMQLPTSPERVYKMLETRAEFAVAPSGLSQWLQEMLAQPEHVHGGPFFRYPPAGADVELLGSWARHTNSAGDGIGGGQPELTSSSVGTGLSSGGSVRIAREANLQLGNLMHGTGHAGAKGKELLHSAGKMGKGLLSKGKNKLRERAESKRG